MSDSRTRRQPLNDQGQAEMLRQIKNRMQAMSSSNLLQCADVQQADVTSTSNSPSQTSAVTLPRTQPTKPLTIPPTNAGKNQTKVVQSQQNQQQQQEQFPDEAFASLKAVKTYMSWYCEECKGDCVPIREESRCLCGHRVREHATGKGSTYVLLLLYNTRKLR